MTRVRKFLAVLFAVALPVAVVSPAPVMAETGLKKTHKVKKSPVKKVALKHKAKAKAKAQAAH